MVWLVHGTHPNWFLRALLRPVMRWRAAQNAVRGLYHLRRRVSRWTAEREWLPADARERIATAEPHFAWVRRGGALRAALEADARFATDVRVFPWSGDNTHAARLEAGQALAALVNAAADGGVGPQHLVGHSHGGNVIAYALRDVAVGRVGRVATIGTPFVSCAGRRLTAGAGPLGGLPLVTSAAMTFVGSSFLLRRVGAGGWLGAGAHLLAAAALLGAFVAVVVFGWRGDRLWGALLARADRREREVSAELSLPAIDPPLLCVRTAHDEAGDGLGAAAVLADLLFALVAVLRCALFWSPLACIAATIFVDVVALLHATPPAVLRDAARWDAGLGFGVAAGWWLYLAAAALVAYGVRGVVFGGESVLGALLVRVTPSAVPDRAAAVRVHTVDLADVEAAGEAARRSRRVGWTRHSALCELCSTRDAVLEWLG